MRQVNLVFLGVTLSGAVALACMVGGKRASSSQIQKFFQKSGRHPANLNLKFAEGSPVPSLEAQLGNLLLERKNDSVVLSLPVVLQKSSYHPFGDGQSNAKMSMGLAWKQTGFPVIGVQTEVDGQIQRKYTFHPTLNVSHYSETKLPSGWFKVQPDGWHDAFYFSFETSTLPIKEFLKGIPEKYRTFSNNRVAPDVAKIGKSAGTARFKSLGEGYNSEPWYAESVHGVFPDQNGKKTAVGGVFTWGIVDKKFGPFKNLYTCFEPRDSSKEKALGVPSGAGWHLIGDFAETLLNNLESVPLPVALGRSHAFSDSAYGLSEVITATWLQSDEALVTLKDLFHWYLNPYESTVCTEIWVHNCLPSISNSWGFNCQ